MTVNKNMLLTLNMRYNNQMKQIYTSGTLYAFRYPKLNINLKPQ